MGLGTRLSLHKQTTPVIFCGYLGDKLKNRKCHENLLCLNIFMYDVMWASNLIFEAATYICIQLDVLHMRDVGICTVLLLLLLLLLLFFFFFFFFFFIIIIIIIIINT